MADPARHLILATATPHSGIEESFRSLLGLLEIGADILRPMFEPARRQDLLRESVEIEVLMEWVLRILMSYLTVPSHLARTDAELRQLLRAMILPAVLANAPADPDSEINHREESRDG